MSMSEPVAFPDESKNSCGGYGISEQITSLPLKISSLAGTAIVDAAGAADGLAAADGFGDASGEGDAAGAALGDTAVAGDGDAAGAGVGVALPEHAARTMAIAPASARTRVPDADMNSSSCDGEASPRLRRLFKIAR
jgi:hypothetical protein